MLTREENRWNFLFLKICSKLIFLPISIDEKSGRISIQQKVYKLYLWYFLFGLELLHSTYGLVRFIDLLFSPNLSQMMDHLFVHSIVLAYPVIKFWGYQLFIKRPREMVMIFNQLFNHQTQENNNANAPPRKVFTWDFKYNRHELLTLSMPFMVNAIGLLLTLIFLSDPDRLWILYSSVPTQFKSTLFNDWPLFLLLTGVDSYFFVRKSTVAVYSFLNQLLFLENCYTVFGSFQQNPIFRNSIELPRARSVEKLLKEMRVHFLSVHLFNRVYAYIVFAWKQSALFYAIFTAFFAIRYNLEYPLSSALAAYIHFNVMFIHSVMYEKAFTVPENWRKVKSGVRVSALLSTIKQYRYPEGGKAALFQKEIQQIPEIGVKVGDFHMLERASTPNFIMFVISSVASLLITFR